jgi:pimeloyl-ACP methyl ester carboxylesterase
MQSANSRSAMVVAPSIQRHTALRGRVSEVPKCVMAWLVRRTQGEKGLPRYAGQAATAPHVLDNMTLADGRLPSMPAIVYLPGASGSRAFWQPVAQRLADLGPAACLGWPGFGDEPADRSVNSVADLARWTVSRLPKDQVDLVAQSMGGVVATLIALEHPQRVRRLVLCATSGGVDVRALGAPDWRSEYSGEFPNAPECFVVDQTDVTPRLPTIVAPTLVLYGDQDPLCSERIARFIAEHIPGAALACIAGGDHMMGKNRPDEVARRIREHLLG